MSYNLHCRWGRYKTIWFNCTRFIYLRGHSNPQINQWWMAERERPGSEGHSIVWYCPGPALPSADAELCTHLIVNALDIPVLDIGTIRQKTPQALPAPRNYSWSCRIIILTNLACCWWQIPPGRCNKIWACADCTRQPWDGTHFGQIIFTRDVAF